MTDDTKEREEDLMDAEHAESAAEEPETLISVSPIEELFDESQLEEPAGDGSEPERLYTGTDLREQVASALAESEDRYLRLSAEYENFRRRTSREKQQWSADALQSFVLDLLPVVDSFEVARSKSEGAPEAVIEGLNAVTRQIAATLKKHGIAALDPTGEPFDPQFHEAFTQVHSPDHAPGTVVEVFEKGYTIQERLVRPARVVVAAAPPSDEEGQDAA